MSTKAVLETLEAARKKIELPEHWTQQQYARNAKGTLTSWDRPEAFCWCAEGALYAVDAPVKAFLAIEDVVRPFSIIGYNDSHTHAEVLAAFDAAIEKAKVTA